MGSTSIFETRPIGEKPGVFKEKETRKGNGVTLESQLKKGGLEVKNFSRGETQNFLLY